MFVKIDSQSGLITTTAIIAPKAKKRAKTS